MKKRNGHAVIVIAHAIRDVDRIGIRLGKLCVKLKAYGLPSDEIVDLVERTQHLTVRIAAELAAVPVTWKATRGSVTQPFGKGDQVRLTSAGAKRYHGIIPPGQLFTIERIVGSKLVCVAADGMKIPLTRSNVQRVAT